jgi:hypothetical protein
MPARRSLDPEAALSPRLLGRETIQLAVVALLSLAALLWAPGWLQVIAGLVDSVVAIVSFVALVVAWRVGRLRAALAVYAPAAVVFALLALANFTAA